VKLLPFVLLLVAAAPPTRAAERMERLFYTADQRAQLDVARNKRARNVPGEKADDAPPPPPMPEVVTYGGMVRRSDGKTTVWLNNRAVTEKESANAKMVGRVRPDGTVVLQSGQTGRNVPLRVGQRADLLSGRVDEGYRRVPPKPEERVDKVGSKPALEAAPSTESEGRRAERERQENLDDAVRAMRAAAQARSAAPAPQQAGGPVTVFPGPMPSPAPGAAQLPAQPYR